MIEIHRFPQEDPGAQLSPKCRGGGKKEEKKKLHEGKGM